MTYMATLLRSLEVTSHCAFVQRRWEVLNLCIRINLSYFPSRARLNFRWILKEFDLKSNMKGFFENLLAYR